VDGVEPLIGKLRELQDALGELRDSRLQRASLVRDLVKAGREHVRRLEAVVHAGVAHTPAGADEDPRPGLLALAERLEEREAEAFARLRADWLAGAADGFFEAVTAAGKRIANRPACVAELERRFLCAGCPRPRSRSRERRSSRAGFRASAWSSASPRWGRTTVRRHSGPPVPRPARPPPSPRARSSPRCSMRSGPSPRAGGSGSAGTSCPTMVSNGRSTNTSTGTWCCSRWRRDRTKAV
jgi:hypothetical protein